MNPKGSYGFSLSLVRDLPALHYTRVTCGRHVHGGDKPRDSLTRRTKDSIYQILLRVRKGDSMTVNVPFDGPVAPDRYRRHRGGVGVHRLGHEGPSAPYLRHLRRLSPRADVDVSTNEKGFLRRSQGVTVPRNGQIGTLVRPLKVVGKIGFADLTGVSSVRRLSCLNQGLMRRTRRPIDTERGDTREVTQGRLTNFFQILESPTVSVGLSERVSGLQPL